MGETTLVRLPPPGQPTPSGEGVGKTESSPDPDCDLQFWPCPCGSVRQSWILCKRYWSVGKCVSLSLTESWAQIESALWV